jgi:hypothetical protein
MMTKTCLGVGDGNRLCVVYVYVCVGGRAGGGSLGMGGGQNNYT